LSASFGDVLIEISQYWLHQTTLGVLSIAGFTQTYAGTLLLFYHSPTLKLSPTHRDMMQFEGIHVQVKIGFQGTLA